MEASHALRRSSHFWWCEQGCQRAEFQAWRQAGLFPSVPPSMGEKLLLDRVLLCSIFSLHMHHAVTAIIRKNFFFVVPWSHHHLSPIASSLPGHWRMFWRLKHNPQLLLWPLTHGIWLYSQLSRSLAVLSCLPQKPDQSWCRKRARPNLFSSGPDLDGLKQIMMPHHLLRRICFSVVCFLVWNVFFSSCENNGK